MIVCDPIPTGYGYVHLSRHSGAWNVSVAGRTGGKVFINRFDTLEEAEECAITQAGLMGRQCTRKVFDNESPSTFLLRKKLEKQGLLEAAE